MTARKNFAIHLVRILLITIVLCGCNPRGDYAPDRNFYFEVIPHRFDEQSKKLADYLEKQIPRKKYTITNQSGLEWPFYKELNLDEQILRDSLMPPHWFMHRMIPFTKGQVINTDEFLVRIEVQPMVDTIPNYSVEIFRRDSTGLSLSGQSGIHFIDTTEFATNDQLFQIYLQSIIRYSFK
jgi:hypothetical protein